MSCVTTNYWAIQCQINQNLETSPAKIFDSVYIFPEERQTINSDEVCEEACL